MQGYGQIGESKFQKFSTLLQHVPEYMELDDVVGHLEHTGVPMTMSQQEKFFDILVNVRQKITIHEDIPTESLSLEKLKQKLGRMDEYERLVMELAPSILSTEQTGYLFERYQRTSFERARALGIQIRMHASDPSTDQLVWYSARSPE